MEKFGKERKRKGQKYLKKLKYPNIQQVSINKKG